MPAEGLEPHADILGEGDVGRALDGYLVVGIKIYDIAELQVSSHRGRLVGDALHKVAVAAYGVDMVVEQGKTRLVELMRQILLSHRHAHAVGKALPQGAGRGLDAYPGVALRVSGRVAAPLPELP